MKGSELIRMIEKDGWYLVSHSKHKKYQHPSKPGQLIIPFRGSKEIATGTANAILKRAGLK